MPSIVKGNSGLSGDVQVSIGDTHSEAGDAAWVFIDTTSCEVARSYITATGEQLPADTDESDLPVAALRPGCANPTDGFKPVPPPTPTPQGKNPALSTENQGNNKPGGGGLAPVQTDPVGPPAAGEPEPTYTPPPAVQAPAPKVTPKPTSDPVPTVVPSEQPVSNGEVVSPGNGATCTKEAKEFGLCS